MIRPLELRDVNTVDFICVACLGGMYQFIRIYIMNYQSMTYQKRSTFETVFFISMK